ncbi:MAG: flagellar motor protein MotB [Bacteroidota bacterium]
MKKCSDSYTKLDSLYKELMLENAVCKEGRNADKNRIKSLEDQLTDAKTNSSQVLGHLKDLSVISGAQAESIKKSLDNIGVKDAYIKDLQSAINRKDSLNMALVVNLKSAVGNMADNDINIKVDKGVVYVDISDKLLFKSGSYDVNDKAMGVLGKVAAVITAQPDIEFMVEGHTDNVAFKGNAIEDNWDLSVKRATSVVRILQNKYHVPPARMTAAGKGEYKPVADNGSSDGKAANRRTRIVILPQLDQFFKLLEKPGN